MKKFKNKIFFLVQDNGFGFFILCLLFILTSILDIISIGLIFPYLYVLISNTESNIIFEKYFSGYISYSNYFYFLSIALALSFLGRNILYFFSQKKIFKFSYKIQENLRHKLFKKYITGTYSFILNRKTENLIQNIIKNIDLFVEIVLIAFLQITAQSFLIIFITLLLFFSNPQIFIYLILFIFLFVLYYFFRYRKKFEILGNQNINFQKKIILLSSQAIRGIKEIKIYNLENYFLKNLLIKSKNYINALVSYKSSIIIPRMALETLVIFFIVFISIYNFMSEENMSNIIPTLSIFAASIIRLLPSINIFTTSVLSLKYATPIIDDLYNDLKVDNEQLGIIEKAHQPFGDFDMMSIENLCFSYKKDTKKPILNCINFELFKNTTTGIFGESGSGKTTLMNLMLGLFNPDKGLIKINNIDLSEFDLKDWHAQIAYIPQETFIIEGSILENIAIGQTREEVDYNKLNNAIKDSSLESFVSKMENGIHENLKNDATNISGGEKQRIALARALYFQKSIIFMDEPTSFLDKQTEIKITETIKKLKNSITFIIISHNPSFIEQCDYIFKLENKQIHKIK